MGCITWGMNRKAEMSHPGHLMTATIAAYGPYYAGRHVARLLADETDIPFSDYQIFGDLAFCQKRKQRLEAIQVPVTE